MKTGKTLWGALLAALILAPALAQAAASYDFIELNYRWYEPDESGPDDLDIYGYSLDASGQIAPYLFFAASYTYARTESFHVLNDSGYQESNLATAGLGAKWTAKAETRDSAGIDLIGTVDFVYADSTGGGDFDDAGGEYDTGYRLGVALRGGMAHWFEIEPGYRYTEVLDEDINTGYIQLRARIHGPIWLVGGYSHTDEGEGVDEWNAGARIYY